ncbi:protein of unknown function [Candidatus Methylacidiphilum fumarolicum]|uniref:DUF4236 domain-containing protein n=1 Tax=Candidatus Methylacidiphilum fumarolicum TaxID=591154 RepID=A0ABM9IFW6_9BACT|nr:protein of unknown function [Candidatus Methylacidiphilum fumarolicum]
MARRGGFIKLQISNGCVITPGRRAGPVRTNASGEGDRCTDTGG